MSTEEELLRDFNFEKSQIEEQEDEIRRGEHLFNQMLEETTRDISRMISESDGDVSEAEQFSRYRLNQLSEEYGEKFREEKRQLEVRREKSECEFNEQIRNL